MVFLPGLGQPLAWAANIHIEGGAGGGGGGNNGVTQGAGGGGLGGYIGGQNTQYYGDAGEGESVTGADGGSGGWYGRPVSGVGGQDYDGSGGAGGGGADGINEGSGNGQVSNGTAGADGSGGGRGGDGGNAYADASDMTGVGIGNTLTIHGGDSGQGGEGYNAANGHGGGGNGGNATLNWGSGDKEIHNMVLISGHSGGWQHDVRDTPGNGQAGFVDFKLDGALTLLSTGAGLNMGAEGNSARFEANGLTVLGGAGMGAHGDYDASMFIHGDAHFNTFVVTNTLGAGNAIFVADGTVTTSDYGILDVQVQNNGEGNASFESVGYHGGGDPNFGARTNIASLSSGNASMKVTGSAPISSAGSMSVVSGDISYPSNLSGNASFLAPNSGEVNITGAGANLTVDTFSATGGQASFSAPSAIVSVRDGDFSVTASAYDDRSAASFVARGLDVAGNTTQSVGHR
jgi:hypothetical protein